jgi:hypothetical protein|tara:strand:- start:22 stop:231 length:210 start_codon:yes stop_codon:yes gene_type:complete
MCASGPSFKKVWNDLLDQSSGYLVYLPSVHPTFPLKLEQSPGVGGVGPGGVGPGPDPELKHQGVSFGWD